MNSRKETDKRSMYNGRPGSARSHRTKLIDSTSTSESEANTYEESIVNIPATTELMKYSKEHIQKLDRLIDIAQKELNEKTILSGREKQTQLKEMENELASKTSKIRQMEDEYKQEIYKLQQKNNSLQKEIETSRNDKRGKTFDGNEDYERRLQRTENEPRLTKVELEETKLRLSKLMGDKQTDNNPNIADLSDRNRPTNLAERYRELYDNQWTDAFEKLKKVYGQDEKRVISTLLTILTKTKEFCDEESRLQMEEIQKVITQSDKVRKLGVPATVVEYIKDCRKASSSESMKHVFKKYQTWLKTEQLLSQTKYESDYTDECFEICWLMAIQDPPVALAPVPKKGDTYSSDVYSAYTVSGTKVDFPVWPAVLLHSAGPVLAKGVVQPLKRPPTAPPDAGNRHTKDYNKGREKESLIRHTRHEDNLPTRTKHVWEDEEDYSTYRSEKHHDRDDYAHRPSRNYQERDRRRETYEDRNHTRGYQQTSTETNFSRTTYQPRNKYNAYTFHDESFRPTQDDVTKYFSLNHQYGDERARILMGTKYDKIKEYFQRT